MNEDDQTSIPSHPNVKAIYTALAVISIGGLIFNLWRWKVTGQTEVSDYCIPAGGLVMAVAHILDPQQGRLAKAGNIAGLIIFLIGLVLSTIFLIHIIFDVT